MQNETSSASKSRLAEIENELESLREKKLELRNRWDREKSAIESIRSIKEEIDKARNQAEEFERAGDLAKVAEIRYGRIPELEKRLKSENDKLAELQSQGKMLTEEIGAEDVAEIVAKWTGVPVSKMLESERAKLVKMEERIHRRLIGQDEAVDAVANAVRRSRAGLQDVKRPIGSFIFIGTTGVGKTEMARALAEFLFDDENAMIRIDMSEYMEKHSVARLIGAPPGYVGYEEGGQLTEAVRRKPYSVILLDEIEKANFEVFNILLQALDDGRMTDGKGRTVNFRNTIFIMTSNIGTELIQDRLLDITEENRPEIMDELRTKITSVLRQKMRPEFLNRVDEIILFKPLAREEIAQIARLQMKRLEEALDARDIKMRISEEALDRLVTLGYDPQFGARPMKRAIQNKISNPLAKNLLESDFTSGDVLLIDVDERGEFIFRKEE